MPAMYRCIIERKVIINVSVSVSSTHDSFQHIHIVKIRRLGLIFEANIGIHALCIM